MWDFPLKSSLGMDASLLDAARKRAVNFQHGWLGGDWEARICPDGTDAPAWRDLWQIDETRCPVYHHDTDTETGVVFCVWGSAQRRKSPNCEGNTTGSDVRSPPSINESLSVAGPVAVPRPMRT